MFGQSPVMPSEPLLTQLLRIGSVSSSTTDAVVRLYPPLVEPIFAQTRDLQVPSHLRIFWVSVFSSKNDGDIQEFLNSLESGLPNHAQTGRDTDVALDSSNVVQDMLAVREQNGDGL